MMSYALLIVAAAIVAKLADIEDRSPIGWGVAAAVAGMALRFVGVWPVFVPVLMLLGAFVALWIAKEIAARNREPADRFRR